MLALSRVSQQASILRQPLSFSYRNMSTHYKAIVIGSGQGGGPLAQAFAGKGQRTALIESTHVGGTCVNEGCTPTKTMVASARAAYVVANAKKYGVNIKQSSAQVNMETVRKRKRDIVDSFRGGGENRVKNTENLDLFMGAAKFTSAKEIQVAMNEGGETKVLTADKIFINAGCSPAPLQIKDSRLVNVLTSTTIMELAEVPRRLVVVGGGYIGIEFAQMFRRFGSEVVIVHRGSHLLPREDHDISDGVKKILEEDGIEIYLNAQSQWFSTVPAGTFVLSIKTEAGDTKSLIGTHVLNATGRAPNSATLDVTAAGIQTDQRGFIKVNEFLETNVSNIYALGDIKGGPAFTHISYDDSRILKHNLVTNPDSSQNRQSISDRIVPYCVFMDPQLGRVGLSETEARKKYPDRNVKVAKMPMEWVARALEMDESRGMMKGVVDDDTKQILGFACLGIDGGELMSMVQLAMVGNLGYDALQDAVFAHPCLSESLNNLWGNMD